MTLHWRRINWFNKITRFHQAIWSENNLDALTLACPVVNPSAFGVAKVDEHGRVLELVENPKSPQISRPCRRLFLWLSWRQVCIQPSARGGIGNQQMRFNASSTSISSSLSAGRLVVRHRERRWPVRSESADSIPAWKLQFWARWMPRVRWLDEWKSVQVSGN